MTIKKAVGKLHLWLGFTSGLLVFIIAVTGCIYAFQKEIQDLTQDFRFVEERAAPFLPPSKLKAAAEAILPDKHIHAVLYSGRDRAAQVIYYSAEPAYYYLVYVDPYTADVLRVKDMSADFFAFILRGHFYLWLPPDVGQPIVATATLVFIAMLVTGIVLWWPKRKKDVKQRMAIRWKARWRRVNYDLHNVPGFYASTLALILATTGLVWGFQWFAKGVYTMAGGDKSIQYTEPLSDTTQRTSAEVPMIDKVFAEMVRQYPQARAVEVHIPHDHTSVIAANANPDDGTYWKIDYRYFDQYTMQELPVEHIYGRFPEAKAADRLIRMNYDIHTGAILGLPGKILAFMASLVCASLPVTGVCIWWGRRKKKRAEAEGKQATVETPQRATSAVPRYEKVA